MEDNFKDRDGGVALKQISERTEKEAKWKFIIYDRLALNGISQGCIVWRVAAGSQSQAGFQ